MTFIMNSLFILGLAVLAAGAASPVSKPSGAGVSVQLLPVEEAVVRGFKARQVETSLRDRVRGTKLLVLSTQRQAAVLTLQVTRCVRHQESTTVVDSRGGPITVPTGGGVARGAEAEYGVKNRTETRVRLEVRASWDGRSTDLVSGERDRSLKEATDTVIKKLKMLVERERMGPGFH